MMDLLGRHKLMTGILVVLIIGAAWWGFTRSPSSAPVLTTTDATGASADTGDQTLVSTLLQLQAVSLTSTILTDPGFLALQDFTTQIVSEPIGRADPFAPISPSVQAATSTVNVNPNLFAPKQ